MTYITNNPDFITSQNQGIPVTKAGTSLEKDVRNLRQSIKTTLTNVRESTEKTLPGNTLFLEDGRVLCLDRTAGDSRYPYGRDGFNFWVYASGRMHANNGLYFVILPPIEGREPQIAFFVGIRQEDQYIPISVLPVPFMTRGEQLVRRRHTVIGPDATWFLTETEDINLALRVFADQGTPGTNRLCFSLNVENKSDRQQELYTSTFLNPFCRHQFVETNEDRWFKTVNTRGNPTRMKPGQWSLPPFDVSTNEDVSRFESVTNHSVVRRSMGFSSESDADTLAPEVCTSRIGFTGGQRIDLPQAHPLTTGRFEQEIPLTVFNDIAVVGDLNRFQLSPVSTIRSDVAFSLTQDTSSFETERNKPLESRHLDLACIASQHTLHSQPAQTRMRFGSSLLEGIENNTFNRFLPYLATQVRICSEIRGYMHPAPNSLIGIRDVFQAIEGHMYSDPESARRKMLEALEFVLVDGRCPRQYSLPVNGQPGRADLREFIDQGVWVISTIHAYLELTGDNTFLKETVGYHRLADAGGTAIKPAEETDTVLDHLVRIWRYLADNRDPETNLVLALYGDWNDALDGLGVTDKPGHKFGTGVSIMVTLQFYQNCRELTDLLNRHGDDRHRKVASECTRVQKQIEEGLMINSTVAQDDQKRILHGWGDQRSYFVGSFDDCDGKARDGLTSNAFWVTSGMLKKTPAMRPHILAALKRLDSLYGMKTFDPGFETDAKGVGRIPKLPIGTAENAGVYIHATAFGIAALFEMGEPYLAWEQIRKILPFAPHQTGLSHSPFVLPNSYVHNPKLNLTGQNMNDWQTGSSNVLWKILIRYVAGFLPGQDQLRIAPANWIPFNSFSFTGKAHDFDITLTYRKQDARNQRRYSVNGNEWTQLETHETSRVQSACIPYSVLQHGETNMIDIVDPAEHEEYHDPR